MPRVAKVQAKPGIPENVFVLDNGAYTLKAGLAPSEDLSESDALSNCVEIPNCLVKTRDRKTYIGAQSDQITQWSEVVYRRPLENGQLVSWEAQKEIWDQSFFEEKTAVANVYIEDPGSTTLVLTETPNTMPALQKNTDEIVMEEWGFGGYLKTIGPCLNAYNDLHALFETEAALKAHPLMRDSPIQCLLVIDSGYSHTTIIPVFEGKPIQRAIRRMEFGGKHLTNMLKEVISIRHFDLHQDTKIVNDIKEDISFVSQNFERDMEKTWKGNKNVLKTWSRPTDGGMETSQNSTDQDIRVDYVLPDGIRLLRGFSRPHDPSATAARKRKLNAVAPDISEVSMTLGNERFSIPELLFHPADAGSKQPGLIDCVIQSLSTLPPLLQATMLANTLVVGGNARIPGFVERLQEGLRSYVNTDWMVRVRKMESPVKSTWLGGSRLSTKYRSVLQEHAITKEDYLEYGSTWAARKFVYGNKGNQERGS